MDTELVIRYLKALQAIELYAGETYPQYAQQTDDAGIRQTLTEFGRDSDRHRQMLADLIVELGGRPSTLAELGAITLAWGMGFTAAGRRGTFGDFQNLQDLLFTEYRDRYHWYILRTVAEVAGDQRLAGAVAIILPDEEKHVSYLETKTKDLASETMGQA